VRALGHLKSRLRPRSRLKEASTGIAIRLGLLRRLRPLRRDFGIGRGTPIDRHYIEASSTGTGPTFAASVLEAGGYVNYTRRFGGDRVTRGEVLYPKPGFADGTLVGDLATGEGIPEDTLRLPGADPGLPVHL
jgi:hypothetical protein